MVALQEISDDKKRLILLCVIIIPVLVSWIGILDQLSYEYLDSSFTSATLSYGAARAINATISMFRTVEVGVGVASMQVGQLLDPINDMVERFSDLIVLAIGSIITQKTFLTIVSSIFFKVLLTISGALLVVSIYIKETPFVKVLTQLFIFLVFIRFVLSLMVVLNFTVDKSFLDSQIKHNQDQIHALSNELESIQNEKKKIEKNNMILESRIQDYSKKKESLIMNVKIKKSELKILEENVNKISVSIEESEEKLSLIDKYNPIRQNGTLDELNRTLDEAKMLVEEKESNIEKIYNKIKDIDEKITYDRNELAGKSNGVIDSIGNGLSSMADSFDNIDVSDMKDKLDKKVGSLLDLLILYTMKTLILPILFMYLLLKAFQLIWGIDLASFIKREYTALKPKNPDDTEKSENLIGRAEKPSISQ